MMTVLQREALCKTLRIVGFHVPKPLQRPHPYRDFRLWWGVGVANNYCLNSYTIKLKKQSTSYINKSLV